MSVKLLALVCSAFLFFSSSFAQPVPATDPIPRVAFPITHVGNVSTIGPRTADAANAAKFSFGVASNGAIFANTGDRLPTPGGSSIPIGVNGTIAKPNVAAALGRFARKTLPVLSVGSALYDLGQELGFGLDNSGGTLVVQKADPNVCTVAPCYGWAVSGMQSHTGYFSTKAAACQAFAAWATAAEGGTRRFDGATETYCHTTRLSDGAVFQTGYTSRPEQPLPVAWLPSSVQEFQDAIAARSGWPATSALARAAVDAVRSGEALEVVPGTVTGPATSPGPVTVTTDAVNNTTTTSTTTHNHTYAGSNVTTTTTTTNVTVDNATNNVISSTTSTTQPVMPERSIEDEPVTFSDTALPSLPKLYEPKYPDGLVGVWNSKKAQLDSAPLVALVGDLMPNVGSGGTCPVWTMPLDFGFFNAAVLDFSVPCFIWDFAKVVIIVSALLLARRLVFGG